MNQLDLDYQNLLFDVLENGVKKDDRTGTGTYSVFGKRIEHDFKDGFPVLTTKKVAWKTMTAELLWFLRGDTNIKSLVEDNCHIWDGDAFNAYKAKGGKLESQKEFIEKLAGCDKFSGRWGELGPIYGRQWRKWKYANGSFTEYIDQIQGLITGLKENPSSRRHLVSAWNVAELPFMTLPPCHYAFQCYVRDGYLDLMWQQRSADLFLGVPFNISSYGLLLCIIAEASGLKPGRLIGNFGDVHLYSNHIEQAREQLERRPYKLPELLISPTAKDRLKDGLIDNMLDVTSVQDFKLLNYESHPTIKAPLSN